MRAALAIAVLVGVAACGGGGGTSGGPWLVVIREVDGVMRLAQVPASGGEPRVAAPEIPGRVMSAVVLDGGTALLVASKTPESPGDVWRIETNPYSATKVWDRGGAAQMVAASRDGKVVLLAEGKILRLDEARPRIVDLEPPRGSKWRGADISEDGQRIVVSYGPAGDDCPPRATDLQCRLEVWAFDRAADTGWHVLARADTVVYNPQFVPGTRGAQVIYHRAIADPSCPGPWACRDEEILQVGFDGTGTKLIRASAWTPRFSRDGKWLAMSTVKDGRLLVGQVGAEPKELADDARFVLDWSPDAGWLSYWPEADSSAAMIRRDGTGRRVLDDGRAVGWLARPLPTGDVIPRKKTSADHVADALALAATHARNGEPIAGFMVDAPQRIETLEDLRRFLDEPRRALVVVSKSMLCTMLTTGIDVVVLDDADAPYLVVTNRLGEGELDVNPQRGVVLRDPPRSLGKPMHVVFGGALELTGVEMPERVRRGETFKMTLHYRVLSRPTGRWHIFVHFDGQGMRFQADHEPPGCGTDGWAPGDYIVDTFEVTAGDDANPAGGYQARMGFFTGASPNWKNMEVTEGDAALIDVSDRVLLGTVRVD